ncbi:MAG: hypothetical protein KGL46_12665 [Hyphomicrobiales bacterium]|nr:hypothetical protein [Hyphomicrobiales bacterium]
MLARNRDLWLARAAVLAVVALQFLMVNDLTPIPRWVMPTLELALLVPLSLATVWTIGATKKVADAEDPSDIWSTIARHRALIRTAFLVLTAVVTVANLFSLEGLVGAMLNGKAANGKSLLVDSLNIWCTNLIIFSLWYWNMDRQTPIGDEPAKRDFIFTQQQLGLEDETRPYLPGYIDYLFLSFTTAAAFSPADTMPLTARAKLLMMIQALVSLVTITFVTARAVGILA